MNDLYVFAVYANPQGWRSRLSNFQRFEHHILSVGCPLTTVEFGYGRRPFELAQRDGVLRIRLRARDLIWHKENGMDIAAAMTPDWQTCACIDGDIHIVDPGWPEQTLRALHLYPLVQITSELAFLGPAGELVSKGSSLMSLFEAARRSGDVPPIGMYGGPPAELRGHGYPGGAWAYRRDAWDAIGGMMDRCIVGAADHHMAQGLLNVVQGGEPPDITPPYGAYLRAWKTRALHAIKRDVGLVPGLGVHYWHGPYKNRGYTERWKILQRHLYDPLVDTVYQPGGVLALAGNKPQMRDELRAYFFSRNEDTVELT